ncbi:hypothetical protein D3C72_2454890 [compost metagenome]
MRHQSAAGLACQFDDGQELRNAADLGHARLNDVNRTGLECISELKRGGPVFAGGNGQ